MEGEQQTSSELNVAHLAGTDGDIISRPEAHHDPNVLDEDHAHASTHAALVSDTKRSRQPTEKGRLYQIDLLTKSLNSISDRTSRQCRLLNELLGAGNSELVHQELTNLDKLFGDVQEFHGRLLDVLPTEKHLEQQDIFDSIDTQVIETKESVCKWLKDQESNCSTSSRKSNKSKASRTSSKSRKSNSSKSSSKLEVLKIEQDMLLKVQHAKREELDCFMRLETAKMESERAQLQQKVMKAELEEEIGMEGLNYAAISKKVENHPLK